MLRGSRPSSWPKWSPVDCTFIFCPPNAIAMPVIQQVLTRTVHHSCRATAHAALEAAQDDVPLPTEVPVADTVAVPTSHDAPHEHRILGLSQLPSTSIRQVFFEPTLLGAVKGQADQLGRSCRNVVAAAVQDRGYQLLEQELSCLLGVCAGEVESLGETRPCQSPEEEG